MKHINKTIDTGRIKLAYIERGNADGIPVLAIHGWLDNAASFECLADKMELANVRLIAVDLPGHGLSDHRNSGQIYHLMDYVVDVVGAIKALGLEQVVILGHSLGGIVGLLTASAIPSMVSRLILLDSFGPMVDRDDQVAEQLRKSVSKICLSRPRPARVYSSIDEAVSARLGGFGKIKPSAARILLDRGLVKVEGGYTWATDPRLREPSLVRLSESQVKGFMAAIECPVCLIAASEGYVSLESKLNPRLSYLSNLEAHQVSGHHHFHLDGDVAATARIINQFLA
ncbi:alpha/beta fold hydrolase [Alkalimarinus sediminis]|uniref:Alpha/beta hydrolase n=1 Tax=Alkalimarinus sediminis TaxID=1632866 RepID=A0A9E8KKE2_9ALTE|nr:alpha/beta hydrolase [Alkalimarinus sediminis]UZW76041.1 alpha/beta hydrolase [Alkalimarinus sediminis]